MKNLDHLAQATIWVIYLLATTSLAFISFWVGAYTAYYLDQAEQKLPSVWETMQETNLPVSNTKLDGYNQIPHMYDEQPAYNIVELEPLQEL